MFQQEVAERIVAAPGTARLWPPRRPRPVALRGQAGDEGPPLRLRAAAQGDVGGRPYRPGGAARGRQRRCARAAHRRRLRPAPQDAAPEPQGAARARSRRSTRLGIDPERRAETLSVADFVAIARALGGLVPSRRRGFDGRALLGALGGEHVGRRAALRSRRRAAAPAGRAGAHRVRTRARLARARSTAPRWT